MPAAATFTPAMAREIVAAYQAGEGSLRELETRFRVNRNRIRQALTDAGIRPMSGQEMRRKKGAERIEAIRLMALQGLRADEIAEKLGSRADKVARIGRLAGIAIRAMTSAERGEAIRQGQQAAAQQLCPRAMPPANVPLRATTYTWQQMGLPRAAAEREGLARRNSVLERDPYGNDPRGRVR